jgi:hypothetical protein
MFVWCPFGVGSWFGVCLSLKAFWTPLYFVISYVTQDKSGCSSRMSLGKMADDLWVPCMWGPQSAMSLRSNNVVTDLSHQFNYIQVFLTHEQHMTT